MGLEQLDRRGWTTPIAPAARAALAVLATGLTTLLSVPNVSAAQGLHGYIYSATDWRSTEFTAGFGMYVSVWSLIDFPVPGFQIGLPSTWITPDNSDNSVTPLCPIGTVARDNWPERGPTYDSVFQTIEGGVGYWGGNRFHYGSPKFSLNAVPDCYTSQVASPGWPFFGSSTALPEHLLGIAQLSNRLLIPPDGLTFEGNPQGAVLGVTYMALPLTNPRATPVPTGEQNWTLFLNASNFKGPLALFIPEMWSRISTDYPFDHGRGLDARRINRGMSGTMEINSVPIRHAQDGNVTYTKIPSLRFPVDADGRTILSFDATFYGKGALYDAVRAWRDGGPMPSGAFNTAHAVEPSVVTEPVSYSQEGDAIPALNEVATPTVFGNSRFGLQWSGTTSPGLLALPQYFRDDGVERTPVTANEVPAALRDEEFGSFPKVSAAYVVDMVGPWADPGPSAGPFTAELLDGSKVVYHWYRFVDQPSMQNVGFQPGEREKLQALVEDIHESWSISDGYMKEPSYGSLVSFDSNLFVDPPPGLEYGYVPIVVEQRDQDEVEIDPSLSYRIRLVANDHDLCLDDQSGGDQLLRMCPTPSEQGTSFQLDRPDPGGGFRIRSEATDKHLHEDGGGDRLVSTRYQPDDAFTRFFLERQEDGALRIVVQYSGRHLHVDAAGDGLVSTRYQPDDATTRFFLDVAGAPPTPPPPPPGVEPCDPDENTACLLDGKFEVTGLMKDLGQPPKSYDVRVMRFPDGRAESTQAVFFESFGEGNFEAGLKMVDACGLPPTHPLRAFWLFVGALSNADMQIDVTDTSTGQRYPWINPPGTFPQSLGDTAAFPCASGSPAACSRDQNTACLLGGRFRVTGVMKTFDSPPKLVPARVMSFGGDGRAETAESVFWESFTEGSFEAGVKMLDACGFPPGHPLRAYWVYYGALTNAETTIVVKQVATGETDVWSNPAGELPTSIGRIDAFACED